MQLTPIRLTGSIVLAMITSTVSAQFLPDSLSAMLTLWHGIPEAEVRAVGLAAGAHRADEVAGALTVLPSKELERFQYANPMQVLRSVSGVNVQEEDGFGLRPNIGLRGSGAERSSRITVMEDGILAAPAPYAAPAAYYFPSIARMSSVEVMKGSSQIAHGPATSGGAINLISSPIPAALGEARFSMEAGSYGGRRSHLSVGGTRTVGAGDLGYLVEFLGQNNDGFKSLDTGEPTGFNKEDRLLKLSWRPRTAGPHSWSIKAGDAREFSHETYLGLTQADFEATPLRRYAGSSEDLFQGQATQLSLAHTFHSGNWESLTTLYRNTFDRNWYKLERLRDADGNVVALGQVLDQPEEFMAAYTLLTGRSSEGMEQLEVRANNRTYCSEGLQHRTAWQASESLRLTGGIRLHRDGVDRRDWRDAYTMDAGQMQLASTAEPGSASNRLDAAQAVAGFVRAAWKTGRWTWTPGLRHEYIQMARIDHSTTDLDRSEEGTTRANTTSVWLPGLGASMTLPSGYSLFAGLHRGFLPPGSNPGTEAEKSWNGELGMRFSGATCSAQVVAFWTEFSNLLGSDLAAAGGTGSGDAFNGGSARATGLEVEWAWDPLRSVQGRWGLPVRGTYTWTRAQFTESFESDFEAWGTVVAGDYLPYLSPHSAALGWSLEHQTGWQLDCNVRYAGAMLAHAGTWSNAAQTDSALLVDAGVRGKWGDHMQWRVAVTNLFDSIYLAALRPYGARPGAPRMLRMGGTWSF